MPLLKFQPSYFNCSSHSKSLLSVILWFLASWDWRFPVLPPHAYCIEWRHSGRPISAKSVKKFLNSPICPLVTLLVSANKITSAGVNFRGCLWNYRAVAKCPTLFLKVSCSGVSSNGNNAGHRAKAWKGATLKGIERKIKKILL